MRITLTDEKTGAKWLVKPMRDGMNFGVCKWVERKNGGGWYWSDPRKFAQDPGWAVHLVVMEALMQDDRDGAEDLEAVIDAGLPKKVERIVKRRVEQITAEVDA